MLRFKRTPRLRKRLPRRNRTQQPLSLRVWPRSAISATAASRKLAGGLRIARGLDDLNETARIEARAADKGAVNIWLTHEFACVLRFNAAAVLDAHPFGRRVIGHFLQSVPNERVGFLCLSGRRIAAGADGPDRLIGNHCFLQFLGTQTSETAT